jgi:hypothetical protein
MGRLDLRLIPSGRAFQSCTSGRTSSLLIPLTIYAFTRGISAVMILAVADNRHLSYGDLVTAWDGNRYRQIAIHGYPPALPADDSGKVVQNPWAFSPLYPLLVRALMTVSGLGYSIVAPTLSLIAGAAAAIVMFALISETAGRVVGGATVALTCTFMSAPVLQLAYTESIALLLVCLALLLLRRRAYILTGVTILLLSITRPISLAFLPVVLAHGIHLRESRPGRPCSTPDRRSIWGLAAACIAGGLLWPVIAAIATGDPLAWSKSEAAWVTTPTVIPGLGWLGFFLDGLGWVGLAVLGTVAALIVMAIARPAAAPWGVEVRAWTLSYAAFMFFITAPVPSVIRFTLLAFPLFWPFPSSASSVAGRNFRTVLFVTLTVVGVFCQWVWISDFVGAVGPSKLYP